ncbi:MAG: hypothetical protein COA99_16380 [Moraxellaceae bacterium]|nr:MAG: hypothetical protein COA99_16380 [Moraxellaceae bacterium]
MKVLLLVLPVILFLFFSCGDADTVADKIMDSPDETKDMIEDTLEEVNEADKIFGVASGKITFEYSGKWTGSETVWFDQYGKRVVIEQDIHHSAKNHNKVKMIWTGDKETSYNCKYISMGEEKNSSDNAFLRPKDTELSLFSHGDVAQLSYSYDQLGDKMIVNKQASGWKSKSHNIEGWIWKGIDLEYNNMGVIKKATSFENLKSIPNDQLDPNKGF